jgi:alpha-mannosidase
MKVLATCLILGAALVFASAQTKRIYIANEDHTYYRWTADDTTYRAGFPEQLDYYLDLADSTADSPPAFQSRWNCDGSLWLWECERNRPAADFDRLIARIKSGHISAPLTVLVSCCGGAPAEAVLRGMYYSGRVGNGRRNTSKRRSAPGSTSSTKRRSWCG